MTKPLRHTKSEIKYAAMMADEFGLEVKLEADGGIRFMPQEKTINTHSGPLTLPANLDQWRQNNAGQENGHS